MIKFDELLEASHRVKNEEDTKQLLVLPMLNSLEYDIGFNTDLRYEYYVNEKNCGKKVDIVIPDTDVDKFVPKIFIEVKARNKLLWNYYTQIEEYLELSPYYDVLGVLTNGIEYIFFHPHVYGKFFTINFTNFRSKVNYYKFNVFTKLLEQNISNEDRLSFIIRLSQMETLNIKISKDSNIKLEKMVKMLPKEATSSSVVELALDCLDRYFTDEQVAIEFKKHIDMSITLVQMNDNITVLNGYDSVEFPKDLSDKIKHYSKQIGISPLTCIVDIMTKHFKDYFIS